MDTSITSIVSFLAFLGGTSLGSQQVAEQVVGGKFSKFVMWALSAAVTVGGVLLTQHEGIGPAAGAGTDLTVVYSAAAVLAANIIHEFIGKNLPGAKDHTVGDLISDLFKGIGNVAQPSPKPPATPKP